MANLKELRNRINTVKSTEKITSAMKMVSASRLRRSQQLLLKSLTYYDNLLIAAARMDKALKREAEDSGKPLVLPELLQGTGKSEKYLLVVFASDRGLCGGYNIGVVKEAVKRIEELKDKEVKVVAVGKKTKDILKRTHEDLIIEDIEGIAAKNVRYDETMALFDKVLKIMKENEFDVCELVYSKFISALLRNVLCERLYPMKIDDIAEEKQYLAEDNFNGAYYDYEPDINKVFDYTLEMLEKTYFYQALINSQASEHGARMASMDNATRNANDMILKLRLKYNRIRQSAITTELTEIISGAEAI
ncbi:MAG: ATP synthase F1 subunit gamma [Lactobacillaceae bacterium]|jgi:F-type H+-transporting ATPase subunit gamma|nr:ATP synthase F1 subunit gamma [Lactobacillaceae bacterium]